MASGPITSWQIDGKTMETMTHFIFLSSKITVDGDCCHEIRRHLLLGRKALTNLDSILKSRDITLPTKVYIVKVMVFPVVMYGYEIWTIKKAECLRIDTLELWCWRRLLRVLCTAGRSNRSILKEINPRYSLEGLMLKLQYFGYLTQRTNLLEKDEMIGWHHRLSGREFEQTPGDGDEPGILAYYSHGVTNSGTQLGDWTTAITHQQGKSHTQRHHYSSKTKKWVVAQFLEIFTPCPKQLE